MFKLLNKKKNNKGFTLVELVIVIAILAILVGLLAPQYTKYVEKSRKTADVSNMDELVKAVQVYAVDHAVGSEKNSVADVTITIKLTDTTVDYGNDATAKAAFDEYVPNYSNIKVKSKKWSDIPTATLKIDKDGGVKAKYTPDDFEKYAKSAGDAATTTATGEDKSK